MASVKEEEASRERAIRQIEREKPALEFGSAWDYSPAPESRDHVRLEDRYGLFIGGKFVAPKSRKYFATINPATEEPLAEVAEGSAADVDAAVVAAEEAYRKRWSKLKRRPASDGKRWSPASIVVTADSSRLIAAARRRPILRSAATSTKAPGSPAILPRVTPIRACGLTFLSGVPGSHPNRMLVFIIVGTALRTPFF